MLKDPEKYPNYYTPNEYGFTEKCTDRLWLRVVVIDFTFPPTS